MLGYKSVDNYLYILYFVYIYIYSITFYKLNDSHDALLTITNNRVT